MLFENKKMIQFMLCSLGGRSGKNYIPFVAPGQGDSPRKLAQPHRQPPTHLPSVAPAPLPSLVISPSIL